MSKRKSPGGTGTLVEHLAELRRRLIYVLLFFAVTVVIGFFAATPVLEYLKTDGPAGALEWNAFSPWDGLRLYLNVAVAVGLVLTFPFLLLQAWLFVRPGLVEHERKAAAKAIPASFALALAGLAFGYFVVFPMAVYVTSFFTSSLGLTETYGATQYLSFMFSILLPLAVLFELPVAVTFLTRIGILHPRFLAKYRRHAWLGLFILSAMITPPDVISAVIVSIPMIALFEVSVWLSQAAYRRRQAALKALEAAE